MIRHSIVLRLVGPRIWEGHCSCGYHVRIEHERVQVHAWGNEEARHHGWGQADTELSEALSRAEINELLRDVNI